MKAIVRIGGGATEEIMTVTGDRCRPFIELTVRDREILISKTEARMVSDALRALALVAPAEPPETLPTGGRSRPPDTS